LFGDWKLLDLAWRALPVPTNASAAIDAGEDCSQVGRYDLIEFRSGQAAVWRGSRFVFLTLPSVASEGMLDHVCRFSC
jgi:hypothetical protein